ncbi:hypothetical protein SAMN06295926_10456 [Lysinibacillus sp. AC-3]|nr:hypothetical protein SAMN06295926_10456 [Lysinibacillus sp. AC-3]
MAINVTIDVMLAKRNGAIEKSWNYYGESFYFEKWERESGSFFNNRYVRLGIVRQVICKTSYCN